VRTNAGFLARCLEHSEFRAGRLATDFLAEHHAALAPAPTTPEAVVLAAARAWPQCVSGPDPWARLAGFRLNAPAGYEASLEDASGVHSVVVAAGAETALPPAVRIGERVVVFDRGQAYAFQAAAAGPGSGEAADDDVLLSPMPGKIVAVHAKNGERVERGQPLLTLEAMKMEHVLAAPKAGVLEGLSAQAGDQVSEGVVLARMAG
jgi:acetyl/propionyl-CoA carboxylase alpha subunit